jgi:O-antigen/teichoic acid export membrane protein
MSNKKEVSLESRALSVSFVSGLSSMASIFFQIISVPICLHYWGTEKYGVWLTIFTVATMLRTIDSGYVSFIGNRLNLLFHTQQDALRETLASAVFGSAILGVVELLLTVLVITHPDISMLFNGRESENVRRESLALLILAISWITSGIYIGIVHRLLAPAKMLYQAAWWAMAYQASVFVVLVLSALLGLSLLVTSAFMAFVQAGVYLGSAYYIRHKLPSFYPWWQMPSWRTGLKDLAGSWIFMASGFLQQASVGGTALLVSFLFGPASLPLFTTVRTMANLWTNVTGVLTTPLIPDLIRFHAIDQPKKILDIVQTHAWLVGGLVNMGIVLLYPVMAFAYGYWTKGQLALDHALFMALLAGVVLANTSALISAYLSGINHSKSVLVLSGARALFSLGMGYAFAGLGLKGIGLAIMLSELLSLMLAVFVLFPMVVSGVSAKSEWVRLKWPLLSLLWVLASLLGALGSGGQTHWLLYGIALSGLLATTALGWRQLTPDVRSRIIGLVQRMVRLAV